MFLYHFDPSDISPAKMVNRDDDEAWLYENFEGYFEAIEQGTLHDTARQITCVTGDKGIGKSILAAKVVNELRKKYSSSTLFVSVDCRSTTGVRDVLRSIARGLLEELVSFQTVADSGGPPLPPWILPLVRVLSTMAHADTASSKTLHQWLKADSKKLKIGGQQMLRVLKAEFDLSIERETREVEALATALTFDVDRLLTLTLKLFQDIRSAGMRIFLLIDNMDELQHEYWDDDVRQNTANTVNKVLRLIDAPIAMLLCMRTYFQAILPRTVGEPRQLVRLSKEEHLTIVAQRTARENATAQDTLRSEPAQNMIALFAAHAGTPLALLTWVKWAAQSQAGFEGSVEEHAKSWRDVRYPDFDWAVAKTLNLFETKHAASKDAVSRSELLTAIENDDDAFRYLQKTELILPRDFWDPTHFVLDPSAAWIMGPHE